MNIDKQIRELITWTYSQNNVLNEDLELLVSQIKQSILKDIMDAKPKDKITITEPFGLPYNYGYNRALEQFESVIKEILK